MGDFYSFPFLAYEDFESMTFGTVDPANGWADGGHLFTYAGLVGYEDFETSTLTNTAPPDTGWLTSGFLDFSVSVAASSVAAGVGGTASLTVIPSGPGGFSYQWFQNGVQMTNGGAYSGVTTATLTITGVVSGDYTTYTCIVSCLGTSVTSATITLVTLGTDWSNRVVANGGAAPSGATVTAIDACCNGFIADGTFSKIRELNCFAPDSLIAALTPLIRTNGNAIWTNTNFVLGDLSVNGLKGNASNKWLNMGSSPSNSPSVNMGFAVMVPVIIAGGTGIDMGSWDTPGGNPRLSINAKFTDGNSYSFNGNNVNIAGASASPGIGFYASNRTSSTDHRLWFAKTGTPLTQLGSTDTISFTSTQATRPTAVFAANAAGTINTFSANTLSAALEHVGASSTDLSNIFTRLQTLRTSFGGGSV